MKTPKIKISEKEYKLLKSIQTNVEKWLNVDNGGDGVIIKKKNVQIHTNEETLYQGRFIRANDRYVKLTKRK